MKNDITDSEDLPEEKEQREDFRGLINKIKNTLLEYYEPVQDPREADCHFTTHEILQQLQRLLPSEHLSADLIANWLHNGGFTFYDFGEMKFEWLLKRA